jgi:plasmid stabilization system protein ParE
MPKRRNRLVYADDTIAQIDRLAIFLCETAGVQTAFDVIEELTDNILSLEDMPHLGSPHPNPRLADKGYLTLFLGRYVCIYRIIGDLVLVSGVFHQRTDWITKFNPVP